MRSRVLYKGDASTRLFAVPFPYLSKADVKVFVNRFPLNYPLDYRYASDGAVELTKAPKENDAIEVARITTDTRALVQFQNGAVLTEQELNLAILQMLYLLQETRDAYDDVFGDGIKRIAGNTSIVGATAEDVINAVVQEVLNDELTALLQQRVSDIDINAEKIADQLLRLRDVELLVNTLKEIEGLPIATFIKNEQTERISGDEALAQTISLIGAKSGDGLSFLIDINKVLVSQTESLAQRLSAMETRFGEDILAAITQEANTRATQFEAEASRVDGMLVELDNSTKAAILEERNARVSADSATSTRIDGLQAEVGTNKAAILAEQTARANGDSANAQTIATVQTTVNGHTASIQTQAESINGIKAQWTVKVDAGGRVAGIGLMNDGQTANFTVLADRFAVVTPGKNPVVPFVADANGVYMDTAYIRNLVVDRITSGQIQSQWNINNSNGRIVLDTGAYMKVIGVGFGAYNDLIEWFGPKMAITSCSKANAITYVGMDGSAYFGGSLRAGTLYNAGQTTAISASAYVDVGPFWTNGNAKTVVVSYSMDNTKTHNAYDSAGFSWNGVTPGVTVALYRSVNGGAFAEVARWTWYGGTEVMNEVDGPDYARQWNSGSATYTDTTGASNITYRAQVIWRQDAGFSGVSVNRDDWSQRVGIVSTEQ